MSTRITSTAWRVTARKLGIPVYFTEGTHRAWMRWLTPRTQMTYKQWLEQCRKQAAARQAEASPVEGDPDEIESQATPVSSAEEIACAAARGSEATQARKRTRPGCRR